MIIVLKLGATKENIEHIKRKIESFGLKVWVSKGEYRTIMGAIGDEEPLRDIPLEILPGVEKILPILRPYKLASRDYHPQTTTITLSQGTTIGAKKVVIMAGPCSVESKEMVFEVAERIKQVGVEALRGGAFKPRTSPYSFQGLGEDGLRILGEVRERVGLAVVTEVMDPRHVDMVSRYADILQIGARNMQNYDLLKEVGSLK
ncbi:MAG TPA: 3-deoxy-7-phosphoheptulonate synthase, partial [Candidatus Omnitrophica bacterium]|nr:3-deoxy-7-phosphoheptulonate synthase [Candidatus Omnitrophota bacterium]